MTIDQLVNQYVQRIHKSKNKEAETVKILREVNNLNYSSGKPVSTGDKIKLLEELCDKFPPIPYYEILLEKSNNEHYLALIASAIQVLQDDNKST
ncbi:hypothetical protein [Bacillus cereus]|uniref:hypothetical protein n=1 Tax=Bacillus cereus TaxID=1396 RepID=UPI0012F9EA88|nr:hypothetical protein [Bacillus cereus]